MKKQFNEMWRQRLKPIRFRPSTGNNVQKGWNPFNSDYTRITMSAPFRRLQDKAQVFPLEPNDFVRTRLTHSIEVSSVARSLGVSIENWLLSEEHIVHEQIGHIPSLLATASLAHDIGNPPFGHFGEECIRKFFQNNEGWIKGLSEKEKADLINFDGNVQGLRLLLRLGQCSDEFSFNLTFPTLATIIKYPKDSIIGNRGNQTGISCKKYGYYQTDKGKYDEINKVLGLSSERHPLCFLLEAADDICYSVSDIEDGFKKNTISLRYLSEILENNYSRDEECSYLIDLIKKKDKEYNEYENLESLIIQDCRIFAQGKMINSAIKAFKDNHNSIINGDFNKELLKISSSQNLLKFFKGIADKNFNHESVIKSEIVGERVISYLLDKLTKAVFSEDFDNMKTLNGKLCSLLSHQSKWAMTNTTYSGSRKYLQLLMVVDFVASMTDSYALSLYKELNGFS